MKLNVNRHKPNLFGSYREIHETVISQFKYRDFISDDSLEFQPLYQGFCLSGEIACLGKILITVEKFLEILDGFGDNATVQTRWYAYNVSVQGYGNIFRYDNQHAYPGHQDSHHKHIFDWRSGVEEIGSPFWVGENGWLTLGEVIQETEEWYWQNSCFLDNSNGYSQLGKSRI